MTTNTFLVTFLLTFLMLHSCCALKTTDNSKKVIVPLTVKMLKANPPSEDGSEVQVKLIGMVEVRKVPRNVRYIT